MASPPPPDRKFSALAEALAQGRLRVEREKKVSVEDLMEVTALDKERTEALIERMRLFNENERALIDLRKSYGANMIRFLWCYFTFAVVVIVADAVGPWKLPDTVLLAIIGGTAVSVLGVVGTIVAGLFQVRKD